MDLREVWFPLHLIGAAFWWDQLCAGDHSAFDAWMTAVGATNPADDIPYDDVLGSAELDLAPNRAVNARVFLSERNMGKEQVISRGHPWHAAQYAAERQRWQFPCCFS